MIDPVELFLGPAGEHGEWLIELLDRVTRSHVAWRKELHGKSPERLRPVGNTQRKECEDHLDELLDRLRKNVPWFCERYAGHMNSDVFLPAVVGYLAAMLGNPNNVAHDGGPATTEMECEVIDALGRMLGLGQGAWGHLASGGTLANIEALWVARNTKYLPLAIQRVAHLVGVNVPVELPNGRVRPLVEPGIDVETDEWELLNLEPAQVLALARAVADAVGDHPRMAALLSEQTGPLVTGLFGSRPSVVLVPATRHYSWDKAADVLGLGRHRVMPVPVDASFRMSVTELRRRLRAIRAARTPVVAVVAVVGSTEEGAIDPLGAVLDIREEFAREEQPLSFWIHADAAYGGYLRTLCIDESGRERSLEAIRQELAWPSRGVHSALSALGRVDSVTVDPHKLGYIPYGAGAVLFRDRRVREIVRMIAPYAFHDHPEGRGGDSSLGRYTLEGSRPGAVAAAVWYAMRMVPLHAAGHGRLLVEPLRGALALYRRLESLGTLVHAGRRVQLAPLTEPDATIVCFCAADPDEPTLSRACALTRGIASQLVMKRDGEMPGWPTISSTRLSLEVFGSDLRPLMRRLGITVEDSDALDVIRVVVMHPWAERARVAERLVTTLVEQAVPSALATKGL